ncbi:MAG: WecB/TagA/CpsF family glycosyltransferase [Acidimicrobiales bacterium]
MTENGPRRPRRRPAARSPVTFLAWTPIQGRAAEIAHALGGETCCIYYRRLVRRKLVPLRYVISAFHTVAYLARRRPAALIVTNPPIIPAVIGWAYGRLTGAQVLLDSHPAAFGAQGDTVSARLQRAHRWLVPRVLATLVTSDVWVRRIVEWGGTGLVLHEAPPLWQVEEAKPLRAPETVLFVGTYGGDEPVEEVIGAAALCPDLRVQVTGSLARRPPGLDEGAPPNVVFTGFLGPDDYARAVGEADVVLTISSEPTSVMRAAYEAVYAGRPLVVSDWPGLRESFPFAVHVPNTARGIAAGLRTAIRDHDALRDRAAEARRRQMQRWEQQLASLRALLHPEDRADRGLETRPPVGPRREPGDVDPVRHLGLPMSLVSWTDLERWASKAISECEGATLFTLAPYQAHLAVSHPGYRACLERASAVLVDGNGILLALSLAGSGSGPRMTGRELVELIYHGRFLPGARVAVLGGSQQAHAVLARTRPAWARFGELYPDDPEETAVRSLAERLRREAVELVLVALGTPKGELWADALLPHHRCLYLCTGGAVDTVTGVRRAPPSWVTGARLEWAWRAAQDPDLVPRLARGATAMPGLLGRALRERLARSLPGSNSRPSPG